MTVPECAASLKEHRALVTGASKGLGAAVAERLAAAGADVVVHYHRDAPGALATVDNIRAKGRRALALAADLANPDAVATMVDRAAKAWHGLDLVVNNAGLAPVLAWDQITPGQWQDIVAVNLGGAFYVLHAALPHLKKSGPGAAAVNISSVVALNGGAFGPGYAATKAGLIGLTRSAARDFGHWGIRVNCVAPGPIDSPLAHALSPAALAAMAASAPLGRLGTFAEVAELICWLLCPAAAYITGQTIVIDGGRLMH